MIGEARAVECHKVVRAALARGALHRGRCETCGATKVEAHHDDYAKPLSVRWFCHAHHMAHHGERRKTESIQPPPKRFIQDEGYRDGEPTYYVSST
jgi:hypothetical protein